MSDPIDHHYLPIFYLKAWCASDGKVVRFYRPHDVVVATPVSPDNTAFEPRLYSLEGYPAEQVQTVERDYMSRTVDSPAAVALRVLLEKRPSGMTVEMRNAWTRFVMSMQLRNPFTLQEVKAVADSTLRENLFKADDPEYQAIRDQGDPPTFYEWALKYAPHQMDSMHKAWLPGLIEHEKIGTHIMNMHWSVVDVSKGRFSLLTGDRPYISTHGLGDAKAVIALPISPELLFIASNSANAVQRFRSQPPSDTARRLNTHIARLAVKQVYSDSRAPLPFVEKHLRRADQTPVPGVLGRELPKGGTVR